MKAPHNLAAKSLFSLSTFFFFSIGSDRLLCACIKHIFALLFLFISFLFLFFHVYLVPDAALDDFVLMHCVFMPNIQLCPVLMAQYPFSSPWKRVDVTSSSNRSTPVLGRSLTGAQLPCPGLTGLRTGEAGLRAQQQASCDPPGRALGRLASRSFARGRHLSGLPGGSLLSDLHRREYTAFSKVYTPLFFGDDFVQ